MSTQIPASEGHLVVGRPFINLDNYYASLIIDELKIVNNWTDELVTSTSHHRIKDYELSQND